MKTSIQIEFSDTEVRDYVQDLGRRWIIDGIGYLGNMLGQVFSQADPRAFEPFLKAVQSAVPGGLGIPQHPQHPQPGCPSCSQRGPVSPWPPPRPEGPYPGPRAVHHDPGPFSVEPETAEPLQHCFVIEETRYVEAGWGCHICATYNGLQRKACRTCGHERCYERVAQAEAVVDSPPSPEKPPVVTPPPASPEAP